MADRVALDEDVKPDPDRGNFWRDIVDPHHDEIQAILRKARAALQQLDTVAGADGDPAGIGRRAIERDLVNMLRYARRLQPDNADVLRMLAQVSDDLGDVRQAREALLAVIDVAGIDHAGTDTLDRLGELALRTGKLDDAIAYLREAQGPLRAGQPPTANALVHLATALALRGHSSEGIDVLVDALPDPAMYEPSENQLVAFALAVLYDRDEQRGAAFEVLDRMRAALGDQLATSLQSSLDQMRFAPAEDELYYRALLYEVTGDIPEARTEWLLYAAAGNAPYRQRALDHARELDAMPHERKAPLIQLRTLTMPPVTP
jgi:tetratricopeptide (TPR) repeat protein